ncbi:MAG: erythromycin esterase family protein [Gemmatimonadaceae bacterium]|nr:erythromycin esterase family protein [Gemmatimonadaceae bacterium]
MPFVQVGISEIDTGLAGLERLGAAIGSARLVQLGESSHGVAEFAVQRERVIRYLHEQKGFSVIALEAPLHDCERAGRSAARRSAALTLMHCAFPVWTVSEVEPLVRYVQHANQGRRPLHLTGFDVQVVGTQGSVFRPAYLRDVIRRVDPGYARQVYALDSTLIADLTESSKSGRDLVSPASELQSRLERYAQLLRWLVRRDADLGRAGVPARDRLIVRQLARTAPFTLVASASPTFAPRLSARDQGMAANIEFLMDSLYPGQRIIVWAHNEHIRYGLDDRSARGILGQPSDDVWRRMGFRLLHRRSEMFTIGLYMRRGFHRLNDGTVRAVSPPQPNSLEERFGQTGFRVGFVDMRTGAKSNSVFALPMAAYLWGSTAQRLVLRDEYDGLLLLDSVGPSTRLQQPGRAVCCAATPLSAP